MTTHKPTAVEALPETLGRFEHHPDPANDFCIEVEEIEAQANDLRLGLNHVTRSVLSERVSHAMAFTVGGDEIAVAAKQRLRKIEDALAAQPEESAQNYLPYNHVILEQSDMPDGRVSQTVRKPWGDEYIRIVCSEEANAEHGDIGPRQYEIIGRRTVAAVNSVTKDYPHLAECYSEIVGDLADMSAQSAPAVPDGWVMVPCEPMTRQAAIIARGVTAGKGDFASCAQTYRDVISAAPGTATNGELTRVLSRLLDNRHSDGTSSIVSQEDRSTIIKGCHDLMIAAASASSAPAAPGREEWREIESAPKDGTQIQVWRSSGYADDSFFVVAWDEDGDIGPFWYLNDGKTTYALRGDLPTHWRPLPSAPAKEV